MSDSINFNNFLVFRVSINDSKTDSNHLLVQLFFSNEINEIKNFKKSYYFIPSSPFLYAMTWSWDYGDSAQKIKIVDYEFDSKPSPYLDYFDFQDLFTNNTSIFKNSSPWIYPNTNKYVYYIFKTDVNGILIMNDLNRKYGITKFIKNVFVLLPFDRYFPLYPVNEDEILKCGLLKTDQLELCKRP